MYLYSSGSISSCGSIGLVSMTLQSEEGEFMFKHLKRASVFVFLWFFSLVCSAIEAVPPEQIMLSTAMNDGLGWSVAIDNNVAVLGAQYGDGLVEGSGVAYIYHRDPVTQLWRREATLTADDSEANDLFGHAVAISGTTVIITALYHDAVGTKSGAAYLFERNQSNGSWVQKDKLLPNDLAKSDLFGQSVAIQRGRAVISSLWDDNEIDGVMISDTGSAYIFERDPVTRVWSEQDKLLVADPQYRHRLGIGVALDGNAVVLGAYWDSRGSLRRAGAAYVFRLSGTNGRWVQEAKLVAPDAESDVFFANDVDISNHRVVVGSYDNDPSGVIDAGAVYIFDRDRTTKQWLDPIKIQPSSLIAEARFGRSVTISGDLLAVGSFKDSEIFRRAGAVHLFRWDGVVGSWEELLKFVPSDSRKNLKFGVPIAFSGDTLLVGAGLAHDNGSGTPREILPTGQAYFFDISSYRPPNQIVFQNASARAGLAMGGFHSFGGGSWGDFNGDRWPDLWFGNHANTPSLYVNNGDGTFTDVAESVWQGDSKADTHGAAWADFDRDGDQDLIELVGAQSGQGLGENHLFINDSGLLLNQAVEYGIDYPSARGRTPIWLDWNNDGDLDLFTTGAKRVGAPSLLWSIDSSGMFIPVPESVGYKQTDDQDLLGLLSDLDGDRRPELVMVRNYSFGPIYSVSSDGIVDSSAEFRFLSSGVMDIAIADVNNDLRNDVYMSRAPRPDKSQAMVKGTTLFMHHVTKLGEVESVTFSCVGKVRFDFDNRAEPIFIGAAGISRTGGNFILDSGSPANQGLMEVTAGVDNGVYIGVDAVGNWQYTSTSVKRAGRVVAIQCRGQAPVILSESGYDTNVPDRPDQLMIQQANGRFVTAGLPDVSSTSVVAADFDNDMDVDFYLVRTNPVDNLDNVLFLNRGDGTFYQTDSLSGVRGSMRGVGDSVSTVDYDQDGFIDLFISNGDTTHKSLAGPQLLLRNKGNNNHWIEIDLIGTASNIEGLGATVLVTAGGVTQMREQSGGIHKFTQNHQRIHFGLAENQQIDRIEIYWPSGVVQELLNVRADQILLVYEP